MRYEDWDVLLFPSGRECRVPMKEFKVACNVVPDTEFSHSYASHSLPVMTCFTPGHPPGTAFHVSIHSWRTPEVSQFTRAYSKHADLVKFEARIFVDGRIVAYDRPVETRASPSLPTNGDSQQVSILRPEGPMASLDQQHIR